MSGGGMAETSEALSMYINAQGYRSINMDRATSLLSEVLSFGISQAAIFDLDWVHWVRDHQATASSRRLAQLLTDAGVNGRQEASTLAKAVMAAPPEERVDLIVEKLRLPLATVLGVSATSIDINAPMIELGMDSLMSVEFGARALKELNFTISLMDYSGGISVRSLAAKVLPQLMQQTSPEEASA
jgi:acyl carrier protein